MARLPTRLASRSDEQLEEEAGELARELAAFKREHVNRDRDAVRQAADERLDQMRARVLDRLERLAGDIRGLPIDRASGGGVTLPEVAALWAVSESQSLRAAVHAAIDKASVYSTLSGKQIAAKRATLEKELDARTGEIRRREAAAKVEQARQELEQAEAELAGSTTRGGAG